MNADSAGWINIERKRGTADHSAYGAYARLLFICEEEVTCRISVDYSERITLFLNGNFLWMDNPGRDMTTGSFNIEISPQKGLNELFIFISSTSPTWKFRVITKPELRSYPVDHTFTEKNWESDKTLLTPESVVRDPEYQCYYVSNYDYLYYSRGYPTGFISKLDENGKILEREWIKGLFAPTGICIYDHKLYVVVRNGVMVFDTKKGNYIGQFDIPGTDFLNDITTDSLGRFYITDSSGDPLKPDIYILEKNQVQPWFLSGDVSNANGILYWQGKLLIGNNGEGLFQCIDLSDKSIRTICSLGAGIIDGIAIDNHGHYMVSHWEGKIFRISPEGRITEISDLRPEGNNAADFEFNRESSSLIIPAFLGDKVISLRLTSPDPPEYFIK